jgi:hypothetical protein
MKILIVAGLVVASTVALSACGKHDAANTPDTAPGAAATAYPPAAPVAPAPAPMPPASASTAQAYPPPATTAGMNNVPPATARTRP